MAELTVIRTDRGTEPLLVMALVGEIGLDTAPGLRAQFNDVIDADLHRLVLDMTGVTSAIQWASRRRCVSGSSSASAPAG